MDSFSFQVRRFDSTAPTIFPSASVSGKVVIIKNEHATKGAFIYGSGDLSSAVSIAPGGTFVPPPTILNLNNMAYSGTISVSFTGENP